MSIVTINDTEYDYDTFNDEQIALITEISMCESEVKRINYAAKMYDARHNLLVEHLVKALDTDGNKEEVNV